MKSVGIREFRDHATKLIAAGETLAIEKHGEPVGFYVPIVAKDREVGIKVLERLDAVVSDLLEQTGLTEDEFVNAIQGTEGNPVLVLDDENAYHYVASRTGVVHRTPELPLLGVVDTYGGADANIVFGETFSPESDEARR